MKCKEYKFLMSKALDGELSPAEKTGLSDHLARCEGCRLEHESMNAVDALLAPPVEIEVSPLFLCNLRKNIAPERSLFDRVAELFDYLKPVAAVTAVVCIFVVSFFIGNALGGRLQPQEQFSPDPGVVAETFKKTMNISVFHDIPEDSFASLYLKLFKDEE